MTRSELKKIIVEELRKVLKEEQDPMGYRTSSGEGVGRLKNMGTIDQPSARLDLSVYSSKSPFLKKTSEGVPCKNAPIIQKALKNKLQLLARSIGGVQDLTDIVGRLSDGAIGPTTVGILNGFLSASGKGNPQDPFIEENMTGYQELCEAMFLKKILEMIETADPQKLSEYFAARKEFLAKQMGIDPDRVQIGDKERKKLRPMDVDPTKMQGFRDSLVSWLGNNGINVSLFSQQDKANQLIDDAASNLARINNPSAKEIMSVAKDLQQKLRQKT